MSRFICILILAISSMNTAAETIVYRLGLSLGGRGLGAGESVLSERRTVYDGQPAIVDEMTMSTNRLADKVFRMRDTITSVQSIEGSPIHYRKLVHEKSKHNVETADFSHSAEGCDVRLCVRSGGKTVHDRREHWDEPVFDMLSMLRHSRGLDSQNLQAGDVVNLPMVNGEQVVMQYLVYEGDEAVTDETGIRHDCCRMSVRDCKYGTQRETMKVFVTRDPAHIPVRLDIIAGSAVIKAVLKEYKD